MWKQRPCFRFVIDNFSQKKEIFSPNKSYIDSQIFVSGGCEWYLRLCPNGDRYDDYLSIYLCVANFESLQSGWKRSLRFYLVVLNKAEKELYRSPVENASLSDGEFTSWGFSKTLRLSEFKGKEFLENDRLVIEVCISDVEAFDGVGRDVSKNEDMAASMWKIFAEHPEFAKDFKPKNKVVKTEYMNVLLNLIETLEKPLKNLLETELNKACSELRELVNVCFKLVWLKSNLEEVSLERKKTSDPDVSRVQQLEERIKNLEQLESSFKMDSLNSKLEEICLERKKANDDWSRVQKLEESVKDLEGSRISVNSLNARLEDISEERMVVYEAVESRFKQLEESVKNLELMVSNLTVELDKDKAKSSDDEFLFVNNVD